MDELWISWPQVVAGEKDWTRSTEFRCKDLTYTVGGLTEGADYYIRVLAVNDAGPGAPGVTEPVTVKEPEGSHKDLLLAHVFFLFFFFDNTACLIHLIYLVSH